jgi:hypothetical protein
MHGYFEILPAKGGGFLCRMALSVGGQARAEETAAAPGQSLIEVAKAMAPLIEAAFREQTEEEAMDL